ncbi:MAG: ribonuclease PH [Desulfobulbaceae bacterium]|uniref:Ribonuclease PH n=1 Tax=Candidatus Desulfatifera sulfidica TaxID=2841691 RepID=A0A8J6TAM4_9BACT|nr:ribonuclease PH [Candidatus Desulfatifera sulfidica]
MTVIARTDNRSAESLRPLTIEWDVQTSALASLMIRMGGTHVLCAVSVEEKVPPFLVGKGQGWITAEYGMLPGSTSSRYKRESVGGRSGRTLEIQRLIGRSLRMMVDLSEIGERTLRVDCDVINADGGTRTASITGGALALGRALVRLNEKGLLGVLPEILPVAAISAGVVDDQALLDLDYREDSRAAVDANFVMTADGRWIEIQTTAEGAPFATENFQELTRLAEIGCAELFSLWQD